MNVRQHCALVAKVAKSLLICIRKNIASRSRDMIPSPYFMLLGSYLECWILCCIP